MKIDQIPSILNTTCVRGHARIAAGTSLIALRVRAICVFAPGCTMEVRALRALLRREAGVRGRREGLPREAPPAPLRVCCAEAGKQSKSTFFDIFERYIEEYMTLFDAIWSV